MRPFDIHRRGKLGAAQDAELRALLGANGVLAALAAIQRQERRVRAQGMRQIGEQRGGFVIGMGHGEQDARHHARFLNRFERVRDALAAARRGLLLLRGDSRQNAESARRARPAAKARRIFAGVSLLRLREPRANGQMRR